MNSRLLLLSWLSVSTFAFVPPSAVVLATPPVAASAISNKANNHRLWSAASTEETSVSPTTEEETIVPHVDHVVCGAGPAGILSAIMLAQKFPKKSIHVYDRRPPPPLLQDDSVWDDVARFYTLGVFGRGKTALETFGVWKNVEEHSAKVIGNQVWREGKAIQSFFNESGRDPIYTLPRDKLVSVLYQHVMDNYKDRIQMHFGQEVELLDFAYSNNNTVLVQVRNCNKGDDDDSDNDPECSTDDAAVRMTTNLLIGADGSARTVANQMEEAEKEERSAVKNPLKRLFQPKPFSVTRFVDDNQRVYKTIPLQLPPDWRHDLGYSTSAQKRRWSIVSLPADRKGTTQCAVWLMKKDDSFATADTDPLKVRTMLEDNFPYLSDLLSDEDVTKIAQKAPSNFPFYRFAGPRLHKGDATVILGDAAHTVKPYNGLGVNSAFEDVKILGDVLDRTDNNVAQAVREFSKERAADSKALVTLSRASDRPGWKVMFTFVIPIMLDAFFSKVAPKLFELPVPALVHNEKYRFHQVARRKRLDRIGQLSIVALALTGLVKVSNVLIQRAATALGQSKSTVSLAVSAAALGVLVAKRLVSQFRVRQTRS